MSDTNGHTMIPLEGFIDYLRQNGFSVGVDSYVKVENLLNSLDPEFPAHRLKTLLCPLFAQGPYEQQRFYYLFDQYIQIVSKVENESLGQEEPPPDLTSDPIVKPKRNLRSIIGLWRRHLFIGTLLTLILTFFIGRSFIGYTKAKAHLHSKGLPITFVNRAKYTLAYTFFRPLPCEDLSAEFDRSIISYPNGTFEVFFTAKTPAYASSWIWAPERDTLIRSKDIYLSYTYKQEGNYNVCLQVETPQGCTAEYCEQIELIAPKSCSASFQTVTNQQQVYFVDASLSGKQIVSWKWDFGDGTQSLVKDPEHTYKNEEEYKVCLSIVTEDSCTDEYCQTIVIAPSRQRVDTNQVPVDFIGLQAAPPLDKVGNAPDIPWFSRFIGPILPWLHLLVLIGVIVGYLVYESFRRRRKQLILNRESQTEPPFKWELQIEANQQIPIYPPRTFQKLAAQLRRRQEGDSDILDMEATLKATINAGGYPTLTYRKSKRPSEYLVLIDRQSPKDHQALLFERLVKKFSEEDVYVDIYYYKSDFSVFWKKLDDKPIYLEDLRSRHPDHRLLVFGTGDALVEAVTSEPSKYALDCEAWKDRALLTPVSTATWGLKEVTIARHFLVLPATSSILVYLVDQFEKEEPSKLSTWFSPAAKPLPDFDATPDLEEIKEFLGEEVFQWFACCALYPELNWNLTLFLGKRLESIISPPPPQEEAVLALFEEESVTGLLNERNLLQLIQLPYFRTGFIPDEVRIKLVEGLSPEVAKLAREAIIEVIQNHAPPENSFAAEKCKQNMVLQQWELNEGNRSQKRAIQNEVEAMLTREELDDPVVLRHIQKRKTTALDFVIPQRLLPLFYKEGNSLLGMHSPVRFLLVLPIILMLINLGRNIPDGLITDNEGRPYLIQNQKDSLQFFTWRGLDYLQQGYFSNAYDDFSLAIGLEPDNPKHYYHRGLVGLLSYQAQAVVEDSTLQKSLQDFSFASMLEPLFHTNPQLSRIDSILSATDSFKLPAVKNALLAPNGQSILASADRTFTVSPFRESTPTKRIVGKLTNRISCLETTPLSSLYLLGTEEGEIELWNKYGNTMGKAIGHKDRVNAVTFSHNTAYFVSASDDRTAIIWDRNTQAPIHILNLHTDWVSDVDISPDNSLIATASFDQEIHIWKRETGDRISTLSKHTGPVISVEFSPDGKFVLSASQDGTARITEINGSEVLQINAAQNALTKAIFSPEGSIIATVGQDNSIKLWDWKGNQIKKLEVPRIPFMKSMDKTKDTEPVITSINFTEDAHLFAHTRNNKAYVWEFAQISQTKSVVKWASEYNQAISHYELAQFDNSYEHFIKVARADRSAQNALYGKGVSALYMKVDPALEADIVMGGVTDIGKAIRAKAGEFYIDSLALLNTLDKVKREYAITDSQSVIICEVQELISPGYCDLKKRYDAVGISSEGWTPVKKNGLWGYVDGKGIEQISPKYTEAYPFHNAQALVRLESTYKVIDEYETSAYRTVGKPGEGLLPVRKGSNWGYISMNQYKIHIKPQYQEARSFMRGKALVKKNGKYGFINRNNEVLPKYPIAYTLDSVFADGSIRLILGQDQLIVKPDNQIIFNNIINDKPIQTTPKPPEQENSDTPLPSPAVVEDRVVSPNALDTPLGESLYKISNGAKFAIANANGLAVTDFQYDQIWPFTAGLAAVQKKGKWGFINARLRTIIPHEYDYVRSFKKGKAQVVANTDTFYIDKEGYCIPQPNYPCPFTKQCLQVQGYQQVVKADTKHYWVKKKGYFLLLNAQYEIIIGHENNYTDAKPFGSGLAPVQKDGKYGYINLRNEIIIPFLFNKAEAFRGGKALVLEAKEKYYIDNKGNCISLKGFPCPNFAEQTTQSTLPSGDPNVIVFKKGSKYGIKNRKGAIIVNAIYDNRIWFKKGLARVKKSNRWGFIDIVGQEVVPIVYEQAGEFSDGLAAVRRYKKWGYIDQKGREVIPRQFDKAETFYNNKATVVIGKYRIKIDNNGNCSSGCRILKKMGIVLKKYRFKKGG